ncbi:LysR substrate-binding domain-containing protein [Roseococcus pinisoli]|uniref:LysR family transcriptional regulator n=1 Tax=Roseococcus pinisoli TaxID=2835040 RepID=A0ABS5Q7G5_9PROT|nr:LysR substrate-binding domain-containing protein [Roseococcus pinisoli]MBS7809607.1 LysR family transcriptional regulator [Roseococcus pinisoli]
MRKTHTFRRPPPLNPLRVFEAAARHRSFTRAAEELGVTQGAVSRAVATLEAHFGFPLFERTGSGLRPCEGTAAFARQVGTQLDRLSEAAAALSAQRAGGRVLLLQAYSGFASRWLLPRLPAFHALHPQVDLRLASAHDRSGPGAADFDARIRYGRAPWRGEAADLLFRDELCPVCSPALLDPKGAPYPAEILRDLPLIALRWFPRDWPEWWASAGLAGAPPRPRSVFEELSVAYEAAEAGHGIALGQRRHLARDLAAGTLFEPVPAVLRREAGYHLTYRPALAADPAFQAFRGWLLDQVRPAQS